MRPIDKGAVPTVNEVAKTVTDYKNWRKDLIDRLGNYCCYCNMTLTESPQVEHVIAQNLGGNVLDWNNLLLACGACNRVKSDNPCNTNTHYLPDFHNTYLAFDLLVGANTNKAFVRPLSTLNATQQTKANATIALCALDRDTTRIATQVTDLRWKFRFEAYQSAVLWRNNWNNWGLNIPNDFIPLLIDTAKAKGFWWVWFRIFQDVSAIREALISNFTGTAANCFNTEFNPIPRNQNDL